MPGLPWVKLYTKYLHDPRFFGVPRSTRALWFEMLMLACELGENGFFKHDNGMQMTVRDIGLGIHYDYYRESRGPLGMQDYDTLREDDWLYPEIVFEEAFKFLESRELVQKNEDGYFLVGFSDEQEPYDKEIEKDKKRKEQQRIRDLRRREKEKAARAAQEA